jgi:hypothetical protein
VALHTCRIQTVHYCSLDEGIRVLHDSDLAWQQTNRVALSPQATVPTERPQLVGEISANFCG